MNKILITCIIAISLGVNAHADIKGASLNKISEKVSSTVSNIIPGEGFTEVDINYSENLENNNVVMYLNRLSDYLFVLSRFYNKNKDIPENTWQR